MPDGDLHVVVRADGSSTIGLGHVMRSFTLARGLRDAGCRVSFRGAGVAEELRRTAGGMALVGLEAPDGSAADARATAALLPDLVVVDGYHFGADFFHELERRHIRYAVIDDNAETSARRPVAVVNPNPHATAEMYAHLAGGPDLLLGLGFALIRPEVVQVAAQHLERVPGVVFVAMGGSDPAGITTPVVTALAGQFGDIWVACGPAMADRDAVVATVASLPGVTVVEQADYVSALARCDVAVLAAGSTLWEAAALGTGVVGIIVADNQRAPAAAATRSGVLSAALSPAEVDRRLVEAVRIAAGRRSARPPLEGGSARAARALRDAATGRCAVGPSDDVGE